MRSNPGSSNSGMVGIGSRGCGSREIQAMPCASTVGCTCRHADGGSDAPRLQLRDLDHGAVGPELPAVIRAHEPAVGDGALGELSPAMRTPIQSGTQPPVRRAPQDDVRAQQRPSRGCRTNLPGESHGVPTPPQPGGPARPATPRRGARPQDRCSCVHERQSWARRPFARVDRRSWCRRRRSSAEDGSSSASLAGPPEGSAG